MRCMSIFSLHKSKNDLLLRKNSLKRTKISSYNSDSLNDYSDENLFFQVYQFRIEQTEPITLAHPLEGVILAQNLGGGYNVTHLCLSLVQL